MQFTGAAPGAASFRGYLDEGGFPAFLDPVPSRARACAAAVRAIVVTLDQSDRLIEDGVTIDVVGAWRWMM